MKSTEIHDLLTKALEKHGVKISGDSDIKLLQAAKRIARDEKQRKADLKQASDNDLEWFGECPSCSKVNNINNAVMEIARSDGSKGLKIECGRCCYGFRAEVPASEVNV